MPRLKSQLGPEWWGPSYNIQKEAEFKAAHGGLSPEDIRMMYALPEAAEEPISAGAYSPPGMTPEMMKGLAEAKSYVPSKPLAGREKPTPYAAEMDALLRTRLGISGMPTTKTGLGFVGERSTDRFTPEERAAVIAKQKALQKRYAEWEKTEAAKAIKSKTAFQTESLLLRERSIRLQENKEERSKILQESVNKKELSQADAAKIWATTQKEFEDPLWDFQVQKGLKSSEEIEARDNAINDAFLLAIVKAKQGAELARMKAAKPKKSEEKPVVKIKVRIRATEQTGSIDEKEFDAATMEKI